jgi:hypothetical protein
MFSLLVCVGNFAKSRCSAAISLSGFGVLRLKIAKFPVKFPVSKELARRRVRSALRRQPAFSLSNQALSEPARSSFRTRLYQRSEQTFRSRSNSLPYNYNASRIAPTTRGRSLDGQTKRTKVTGCKVRVERGDYKARDCPPQR